MRIKVDVVLLFVIITILLASVVSSQPVFDQTSALFTERGLIVAFPPFRVYKQNTDIIFNFHVYNQSTGVPITNDSTKCSLNLFDNTGNHVVKNRDLVYDAEGTDWEINLSASNFSRLGEYGFIATCNSSVIGGFDEHTFIVTEDGEEHKVYDPLAGFSIVLFLLLFNILLFVLPFMTKFTNNPASSYIIRHLIWIMGLFMLWFNMTLFRTIAIKSKLGIDNFLLAYWWMFTLAAYASIFIMIYVTLVGVVNLMKQARIKRRMGDDEET